MSSAWSITAAVNPPRAVYLDYPLGHTAGRKDDPDEQVAIMRETLKAFEHMQRGDFATLPFEWSADHGWKDSVMRPQQTSDTRSSEGSHEDSRVARFDTPQYQSPEDAECVEDSCPTCFFPT